MKLLFCMLMVLSVKIAWANEASDMSEKQLFGLLNPINSFTANFNQQQLDPQGNPLQTLTGVLHGQKPNKVYWTKKLL